MNTDYIWQGRNDGNTPDHNRIYHAINHPSHCTKHYTLIGFASDEGVRRNQGRLGARHAPNLIRDQLANMAIHHPIALNDLGTVICQDHDLEKAQSLLATTVTETLQRQCTPIVLGGGHEVAFGSFQGIFNYAHPLKKRIGIINFDAHFDLRTAPQATSGTPFNQAATLCKEKDSQFHYLCVGIALQNNTKTLFNQANALNVNYIMDYEVHKKTILDLKEILDRFLSTIDLLHLSIDLDVFPQYQAPGVSAPAIYGVDYKKALPLIQYLFASQKLSLFEIAEYNPEFDRDHQTAKLAAHLIYELIHNTCS